MPTRTDLGETGTTLAAASPVWPQAPRWAAVELVKTVTAGPCRVDGLYVTPRGPVTSTDDGCSAARDRNADGPIAESRSHEGPVLPKPGVVW